MKKTFFYKLSILIILNCILVTNYAYSQSPPPPVSLEEYEIDTAKPVGFINGKAGVSSSGTATYQIPIFCL